MASTLSAPSTTAPHLLSSSPVTTQPAETPAQIPKQPQDVVAQFNYYKDPGDGSKPAPSYVGKPETYERPAEPLNHIVHDIRGSEDKYSLDTTGFQVYKHVSEEKDFIDDEEIKRIYYPEVEQILKAALVVTQFPYMIGVGRFSMKC